MYKKLCLNDWIKNALKSRKNIFLYYAGYFIIEYEYT